MQKKICHCQGIVITADSKLKSSDWPTLALQYFSSTFSENNNACFLGFFVHCALHAHTSSKRPDYAGFFFHATSANNVLLLVTTNILSVARCSDISLNHCGSKSQKSQIKMPGLIDCSLF